MSKEKDTSIVPKESQQNVASVDTFIEKAITSNLPVETMERLFTLREKVLKEQAKSQFIAAMAKFQENCPVIKKTKKVLNKDGTTVRYQYAPLDSIVEQIKKPLSAAGLSYRWETKRIEKEIVAICYVTNVFGHTESSDFSVPIDVEGYMTAPQKVASALTFAKRYSLCNALGISTGDEDDDSNSVSKEKDAKSIKSRIMLQLRTLGHDTKSKEAIGNAVKELTQLELADKNFAEISSRLQLLIDETQNV